MAAYAALVSLMHIIDKLERHPSPPTTIQKQQAESLIEKVNFLQKFLEGYNSPFDNDDEADPLEIRIADATHAAEDVIETEIVDQISRSTVMGKITSFFQFLVRCKCAGSEDDLFQSLQKVIERMDLIKKEVMDMASETVNVYADAAGEKNKNRNNIVMVGFDDLLLQLLDRLTGGQRNRQIIPIVGMGGIGKTTLAKNVFGNSLTKEHFDVCLWATISHDYNVEQSLGEVLSQVRGGNMGGKSENELGEELYKYLAGKRYLIVMDDMWSLEVWDKMKFFFPDYNNGSRVLVTTRMSNLGVHLTDSNSLLRMKFLDELSSWDLFSKIVFGGQSFHVEFERIGKEIVNKCNGLPLSIVVIGGLLAKSQHTIQYWQHIERNLNSIVNSEDDEYCSKLLKISYNYLPAYLKPCFLHLGMYDEDSDIKVSKLLKLWVSEGFLKPINNKSLETVAEEYFKELVDRNLILVHELGLLGNVKYFKIHDLLRDLSLKEGKKQRFYHVIRNFLPRGIDSQRRIFIPEYTSVDDDALKYLPQVRSYACSYSKYFKKCPVNSRMLRTSEGLSLVHAVRFVNSRYIAANAEKKADFPSSISRLWNLHALIIVAATYCKAPIDVWKMSQLRYVKFEPEIDLTHPPSSRDGIIVIMENLHTLKGVINLILNEEMVRRIPNIKKLSLRYYKKIDGVNCISYLRHLESLDCSVYSNARKYLQRTSFPHSLKNLTLSVVTDFELEDIWENISSLPFLQKLVLTGGIFRSRKWETTEGKFPSLKLLSLRQCLGLENWEMSESSHFPCLQVLYLAQLEEPTLEIPLEIGEIATLKSMVVAHCTESVVLSAKRIVEEQEDLQGEHLDLHVRAILREKGEEALQSLASANFQVEARYSFELDRILRFFSRRE